MTDQEKAQKAIQMLASVVLDTVVEMGDGGAPTSSIYNAFQAHNISYDVFVGLVGRLEEVGLVRHSNHTLYPTALLKQKMV